MPGKDVSEHVAGGPADVDDRAGGRKVVRLGDRRRLGAMDADHRFAELRGLIRVLRQVLEEPQAGHLLHRRLAGLDRVLELSPGLPHRSVAQRQHRRTRRPGGIAAQRLAERCQPEPIVLVRQDADTGQGSHEAMQRPWMGACRPCQLGGRLRACREVIGQTKPGRGADQLRHQ